jgi:hypothetical protein
VASRVRFRDRFLTPRVARAITSPSAILAIGAGAAAGILVGLGPLGAVALGAAAFAGRVIAAVPRAPRADVVDPRRLEEPWRSQLLDVRGARRRYDDAVRSVREGPLRDRLEGVGARLDDAVMEAGRIAEAGNALAAARRRIDTAVASAELAQLSSQPPSERSGRTAAAVQAQLDAANRLDLALAETYDRLRLLDARIDETVARTVELSVTQLEAGDEAALSGLGDEVDAIVGEMEALRQAVEETRGSVAPPAASPSRRAAGGTTGA